MQINKVSQAIEKFAPRTYQESYDNSGFQVGNSNNECTGVLLCLDITEAVIDEAITKNYNLIVAHHPLIFSGLKSITGKNAIERSVIKAIKNDICLYAAHTNLDSMALGVNKRISDRLGLINCQILSPIQAKLYKLYSYCPTDHTDAVLTALYAAGAGSIGNYDECSFSVKGIGSFKPNASAQPIIGSANGAQERVSEDKIEVLVPEHSKKSVIKALNEAHPYEVVAYELIKIENAHQEIGAGMIGEWPEDLSLNEALHTIKNQLKTNGIRHTAGHKERFKKIALCGGSGSFLLKNAQALGADMFITADYKYHQFFDAEQNIVIADIGHYESEQFTQDLLQEIIQKMFPELETSITTVYTNPVQYFH